MISENQVTHKIYFQKKANERHNKVAENRRKLFEIGKILNAAERMRVRGQARARGQALALAWSYYYVYNKANCTTCSLLCSTR